MRMKGYCGQYVLKSVLKYYLKKEYSIKKLAKLSEKFAGGFTLTAGLAYAALHEGLNVNFLSSSEEINDENIKKNYRKEKSEVVRVLKRLYKKSKKLGLKYIRCNPKLEDLTNSLDDGNVIISVIDYGKIYGINKQIFHFALLTGYDERNIYFHDVGPKNPKANKKINKELFYKAYSAKGTDFDALVLSKR